MPEIPRKGDTFQNIRHFRDVFEAFSGQPVEGKDTPLVIRIDDRVVDVV